MSVFRVEKNKGYTVMSNHHLRNHTLSLKAKGLLSQMLSLPDDWDYTLQGLAQINKESIDAIREAVRELERAGYIKRSRERDERGCLRGTVYTIYEQPHAEPTPEKPMQALPTLDNPILEKPMLDKPTLENPMQLITKERNKEKQNTDQSITDSIPFPSGFPDAPTQKRTETKEAFDGYLYPELKQYVYYAYPSDYAGGCQLEFDSQLSINSQSEQKEGAWAFLSYLLSDAYQQSVYSLPVNDMVLGRMSMDSSRFREKSDRSFIISSLIKLA